jgi:uncharacterized protein (DUF1330 family)
MKRIINTLLVFSIGLSLGVTLQFAGASEEKTKTAYLIVSSERNPEADYGPYSNAAGPLARDAGIQVLASSQEPLLLEGEWPFRNVTLEVFPSMTTLTDFWYSEGYQAAKKLRDGLATINFIVAIEGD